MIFWDASAAVALLFEEGPSVRVRVVLEEDADMAVWWGTSVECLSAIGRREREAGLAPGGLDDARRALHRMRDRWTEIAPTDEVRTRAEDLMLRHPLRAGDALQLGAALVWAADRPSVRPFCSLDRNLARSARGEGFVLALP